MEQTKRTPFYVLTKEFNTGRVEPYDVLTPLFNEIFNEKGKISKKNFKIYDDHFKEQEIKTKDDLKKFIDSHFMYRYWAKCEWEFIMRDWPPGDNGRDRKIDVYEQLKMNIDLITDIVWYYVKDFLVD